MNLHQALSGIAEIRQQIDRAESYRGFRSTATAFSGLCAILCGTGFIMTHWHTAVFDPLSETSLFLGGWIAVAFVAATGACIEMFIRARRDDSQRVWRMHKNIAVQILPAFVVAIVLTWLLVKQSSPSVLPGVWAMTYGLALIACVQHLPISARWVAAYFILGGIAATVFPPVTIEGLHLRMMVLFGTGQLALGGLLHWNLERVAHV